jgi:membrane associated rhomboid family serine protease
MKLKYNAPVSLTFALICAAVLVIDQSLVPGLISSLFTAESTLTFKFDNYPSYIRLVTHVFGHDSWSHLLGNLTLILLLGPILEEKHGSRMIGIMMSVTALVCGLVNVLFFSTELLGASGIVFMMIVLVSFVNIKQGEIPITLLLVIGLYLLKEILAVFEEDDISQISHILGGVCGCIFGFSKRFLEKKKQGVPNAVSPGVSQGGQTIIT